MFINIILFVNSKCIGAVLSILKTEISGLAHSLVWSWFSMSIC